MTAPTASEVDPQAESPCALTVQFGSYAMGIDQGTANAVEQLLQSDRAVQQVDRRPWGREGEFDLCVKLVRGSDGGRLFDRIRALLPAKPRGPISLRTDDGRSFATPPR